MFRNVTRTLPAFGVLSAAALLVAGCSTGASDAPSGAVSDNAVSGENAPAGTAEPVKFSFLYSPYADYAPFFVAEEKGYFADNGLDVELISKGGGSGETYQLVSTGDVTAGGATWGAGLFNATEAGATLDVIASVSKIPDEGKNPSPFVVRSGAGISDVADLKGKRVGIPGDGGFGIYSVELALRSAGLSVDDVELVNVGPPETAPALTNGSVDAAWTVEPISSLVLSEGIAEEVLPVDYHSGTELGALVVNSEFADANPEAVVAFTAAYLKAVQELAAGGWDDPEIKQIIADYTELPVETLDSIGLTKQDPTGAIDWEDVRKQEQFFRERGSLEYEGEANIESAFRGDLLEQAQKTLQQGD